MAGGTLRLYLGAAPGVDETYAMLGEGRLRAERGSTPGGGATFVFCLRKAVPA